MRHIYSKKETMLSTPSAMGRNDKFPLRQHSLAWDSQHHLCSRASAAARRERQPRELAEVQQG